MSMTKQRPSGLKTMLWGASLIALISGLPAYAQEAAPVLAQPAAADETTEVIVTAQKRRQRAIDVPIGMNVLSGEALEKRAIDTVNDLQFSIPGLTLRYDGPGSSQIFMRGVSNIRGSDAQVSIYMDDLPVTMTGGYRQLDLRMLDIERIEVLKGPQGTLYGQGAMAGTIRFVTVSPSLTGGFSGEVKADYSVIKDGDANPKLSGAITVPLIEGKMALRLAGQIEEGGGWIDQPGLGIEDGNNQDLYNLRAKLYYKPNDVFDLTAMAGIYEMESEFGLAYENEDRTRPTPLSDDYDLLPPRHDHAWFYNLTANYDLGFGRLTSSTSYSRLNRDYTLTYIAGPGTGFTFQNEGFDGNSDRAKQFTQEVRLSSSGEGPWQYTVGAFYRDAEGNLDDAGISYYAGGTYPFTYRKYDTSESISLFGDLSYKFTDKLTVGAGVRTFRDKATAVGLDEIVQSETFKSTDPRVYFTYALDKRLNVYGNIAKGFRSGGFNAAGLPDYDPEKILNYELGTKGQVAEGRVRFDLAAFFSQYDDALRTGQFFNFDENGGSVVSLTRNVGEIEVKGLEGSVDWWISPDWSVSATAAYTDSEVTKVNVGSGETAGVEVGDPSDYTPKLSYSLATDYEFNWSPNVEGFVHADYSYRDKISATDGSVLVPRTQWSDSVGLLNARIGAKWSSLAVELYANNITDENKTLDPYWVWQQSSRSKPRTVGITLSHSF